MSIELHHTIIPCADKKISVRFYERLFGFEKLSKTEHYRAVKVNEHFHLLFDYQEEFQSLHLAFKVDDITFEAILQNIKKEELFFGSDCENLEDMQINHWHKGKGFCVRDPNGHIIELLTKDED